MLALLLWVAAVILVVAGIVQVLQGQVLLGLVLIIVGCAVGPGGWTVYR